MSVVVADTAQHLEPLTVSEPWGRRVETDDIVKTHTESMPLW
jgi:hypothetical protein